MAPKATKILLLGALLVAAGLSQVAIASHVRPKGATPLRVPLVVAHNACQSPNSAHNSPFLTKSCSPPVQSSQFVTAGTPDANGAGPNLIGHVQLQATATDILIQSSVSDVRCRPATNASVCPFANAASGPDYTGILQLAVNMRISDHNNSPLTAATSDTGFFANMSCSGTSGTTTIGSTCGINSSVNALFPGAAPANLRTVYQFPRESGGIQVYDTGAAGTPPGEGTLVTLFLEPGVFLP
jgi:hypothetical protein